MRVLEVTPNLGMGGLERVATRLAVGLRGHGFEVTVCAPGGGPFEALLMTHGVTVERVAPPKPSPLAQLRAARDIARALRHHHPDIIHAHNPAATTASALAQLLTGFWRVPLLSTYHGVTDDRLARSAAALRLTRAVVVGCGPGASRELRATGFGPGRLLTIPNGVRLDIRRDAESVRRELGATGRHLVVTVGRCVEQKNQAMLVEAVDLLRDRRPSLKVVVVGNGPLAASLAEDVARRGLSEHVALIGEREDALDLVAACDTFVLSSEWEGFPLSLLEAMGLGRAVAATRVRGVTDLVEDGSNGLLVPAGDAPQLARAIARLLDNPELRKKLGASASRLVAEEYSDERMIERYSELYDDLVQRRPGAGHRR